jgi:FkbM family methyltransferase
MTLHSSNMAITASQARAVTGLYSLGRRSGLLETQFGRKLFTTSYFLYKRYVEDAFAALAKRHPGLFRDGDILDVGANIGYTAAVFAHAADRDATVYAFEPEPFNFRLLQASVRDRHLEKRVVPVHSAVGERSGDIQLWINEQHHADHRVATDALRANVAHAADGYVTVPMISVDEFLAQRSSPRKICLVKIDVQGYELAVCRGMESAILHQPGAAIAIEYMPEAMTDLGYQAHALLEWFQAREFKMYSLSKDGRLTAGISNELAEKGYVDLVFTRAELV